MGTFLSRQRDFSDNILYVELSVGGKSKAGKDMLDARYDKEQKSYVDPRDAVSLAIDVYKKWSHDYFDEDKKLRIVGIEKPIILEFTTAGIAAAKQWADRTYASMKKCAACSKPMGNKDPYEHDDLPNTVYCTEICLANKYRTVHGVEAPSVKSKKQKAGLKP